MSRRRQQASPDKRDQLAKLVDVAYSERSPEQRDRIYQWILRASPSEVRRIEKIAHERAQEAFREWELERENDVWQQFEEDSFRAFAYSRFVCPLTDRAFFYFAIDVGEGEDERIAHHVIEAKQDADPAQLAQKIRAALEKFDAAERVAPDLSHMLQ